jgi:hypothetical protein
MFELNKAGGAFGFHGGGKVGSMAHAAGRVQPRPRDQATETLVFPPPRFSLRPTA